MVYRQQKSQTLGEASKTRRQPTGDKFHKGCKGNGVCAACNKGKHGYCYKRSCACCGFSNPQIVK